MILKGLSRPARVALVIGVLAVAITVWFAIFGIFRWTRVIDIKYPVIAIRADGSHAFAASRSDFIVRPTPAWTDAPEDGAILIDSDFRIYEERNVRRPQSDLGWLIRRFTHLLGPPAYKMELRRRWRSGLPLAQAELAKCQSFASGEDAGFTRWEIARQTTMAGIVAIVNRNVVEPTEPVAATLPMADASSEAEAGKP
jgi:hypothetical protein